MIKERFELVTERLYEAVVTEEVAGEYASYFEKLFEFVKKVISNYEFVESGELYKASIEVLDEKNRALYEDIFPKNYEKSFYNPEYAVEKYGKEMGCFLSFLAAEMRALIGFSYEQDLEPLLIRLELLMEVYTSFVTAKEENMPVDISALKDNAYWFLSDYAKQEGREVILNQIDPSRDFAKKIVMESDLTDLRYLYYYGEYIDKNEIEEAKHLLSMSEKEIQKIADTYTEGYRIGFEVTNKDIRKKKTVNIRYHIGFERVVRKAVGNFRKMGFDVTIYRAGQSILRGRDVFKVGFFGTNPNKQFDFDHKEDLALFMDKMFVARRLEGLKENYEENKELADVFGGPAVIEIFGEKDFEPINKASNPKYSSAQQKLCVEYASRAGEIVNEYIKGEERSFTIIAFPVPEIGDKYEEIFDEIVKINTLDYKKYQRIQQVLIDTLDKAKKVHVVGGNGNKTDLYVSLRTLENPDKETNFENCVADVNIPVGEVFTSPKLEKTDGILHVKHVFLNAYEFKDLEVCFQNGMIVKYGCTNFASEAENLKYVRDNILFHHDTLPIGEFAIGTNTTAYVVCRKYGIEDKLPILIAEKMGPHFAVGDTCYSHSEDLRVYNP
ncbi:MAG: aminopeptidase, partial [Lachnospiraceae bacterium]|nr:aminopeptidase [Lachnospiraceae bacterium]